MMADECTCDDACIGIMMVLIDARLSSLAPCKMEGLDISNAVFCLAHSGHVLDWSQTITNRFSSIRSIDPCMYVCIILSVYISSHMICMNDIHCISRILTINGDSQASYACWALLVVLHVCTYIIHPFVLFIPSSHYTIVSVSYMFQSILPFTKTVPFSMLCYACCQAAAIHRLRTSRTLIFFVILGVDYFIFLAME